MLHFYLHIPAIHAWSETIGQKGDEKLLHWSRWKSCYKEDGIQAKYLMGSFHFLTKFSLQTPRQMSTLREFISLLETI